METRLATHSKTLLIQTFVGRVPKRIHPDDWHPWTNTTDRQQTISMAAHRAAREYGLERGTKITVFVFSAWSDDPCHKNGQPMTVLNSECIVSRGDLDEAAPRTIPQLPPNPGWNFGAGATGVIE